MMVSVETYLRRGQRTLRHWAAIPGVRLGMRALGYSGGGFLLSAASLGSAPQPLAMGLCCAVTGWRALAVALGSVLGYRFFWGDAGLQGMVWAGMGGILSLILGKTRLVQDTPLLLPSLAAFFVSAIGLVFQILWMDDSSFGIYALRIALAAVSPGLFRRRLHRADPLSRWLCGGLLVLSLAQAAPVPWLSLGYVACGIYATLSAFPAAVLAGVGLDLAQITAIPMTAVLCTAYFLRLLPFRNPWLRYGAPAAAYIGIMGLWGSWDLTPLPGLVLGGAMGAFLPAGSRRLPRPGQSGHLQVRLELAANVLAQTQQLLLEGSPPPIDEEAILEKVRLRACGSCSARGNCRERETLTLLHLRQSLDFECRKPGRLLGELRRGREQLATLRQSREQQREYRWALIQQYQFLSEYLRGLSERLLCREPRAVPQFRVRVSARSCSRELSNGDHCLAFPGDRCRYFVLLCDGMGTGLGAAREGQSAGELLKQMLTAGIPAQQALRSINSLLILRGQAGAVTLDLAEIALDTGKVTLYKWGAAPSYLLTRQGTEKLGTATAPPGISLTEGRESALHLTLRRGQSLILLSDGADFQQAVLQGSLRWDMVPGDLASAILGAKHRPSEDDTTAVVLQLEPLPRETSA